MKRKNYLFGAIALAGVLCVSLCGCELFGGGTQTPSSSTVTPSTYEIATKQGYDGSEASYLASLYADTDTAFVRTAYDEAVKEGYAGSFLDFLKEYLTVTQDDSSAVNRAMMSAVSVWASFNVTVTADFGGWRPSTTTQQTTSAGSGIIYSLDKEKGDAYIITNYHVVYNVDSVGNEAVSHISDNISLYLYASMTEANTITATYVGGAMDYDIAVLKVTGSEVLKNSSARAVVAANSDAIAVGDTVYAIGNPDGQGISVSQGIVSVDAEYIDIASSDEQRNLSMLEIRTDAPVNHGNSGGGLFSAKGELIGIVNARSEASGVEGFGYAIPSNLAIAVAQNVLDNQAGGSKGALRATLGVTVQTVDTYSVFDEDTQRAYVSETVKIQSVAEGTAAAGKLQAEDVLYSVSLNGVKTTIARFHALGTFLFQVRKGDVVTVEVYRGESVVSVDLNFDKDEYFTLFA